MSRYWIVKCQAGGSGLRRGRKRWICFPHSGAGKTHRAPNLPPLASRVTHNISSLSIESGQMFSCFQRGRVELPVFFERRLVVWHILIIWLVEIRILCILSPKIGERLNKNKRISQGLLMRSNDLLTWQYVATYWLTSSVDHHIAHCYLSHCSRCGWSPGRSGISQSWLF